MPSPTVRFTGFPRDGVDFFRALALQQNREWFQKHKEDYEALWALPMQLLMARLRERLVQLHAPHSVSAVKVFRLNRDVRFAKDKSPYKTHCAAILSVGEHGVMMGGAAALYLHLGLTEAAATGFYVLEPDALARYRARVLDRKQGPKVKALVKAAEAKGQKLGAMESVKKAPRGIDPGHPRIALLRHKGFALTFPKIPKAVRFSASLEDWLFEQCRVGKPLLHWGLKYVETGG